jgi:dolichyl-phosphate beta-glucosyltransferase
VSAAGAEPRQTVSLVVPAYNEEGRLGAFLEALGTTVEGDLAEAGLELVETVVVDDGSTDATVAGLSGASAPLRLLRRTHSGKGGAVAHGVAEARGELVLISDLDLATPVADAGRLLDHLRAGADVAVGSRRAAGADVVGITRLRGLAGQSFGRLARMLVGQGVADTQCGFKLMPAPVARRLTTDMVVSGFAYDVELLLRARREGLRVDEVPVRWVHATASKVKLVRAGPRMVWELLLLARAYGRGGSPAPRPATPASRT